MLIAVFNESTLVNDTDCDIMCQAIQIQLDLHVCPAWGMTNNTIKFYADKTKAPGYAWAVNIMDNSTVAGALGYHAEDSGKVDAFIFCQPVLSNGGVVLHDPTNPQNVSVSSVLSHEVCEMVGDRYAGFWSDGPATPQGSEYALELCDAVEGDSYEIDVVSGGTTTKVSVSNFVFPSWFNPQATSPQNLPFDYLKKLSAPFTMTTGGYIILRKSGKVSQIFGAKFPEWKKSVKTSEFYRR
jgi:hypothetical protein